MRHRQLRVGRRGRCLLIALKFGAFLQTGSVSLLSTLFDSALDASRFDRQSDRGAPGAVATRPDAEHRFGHGKAEAAGGPHPGRYSFSALSIVLVMEVVDHFTRPQAIAAPEIGIAVMVISLIVTGLLVVLQRHVVRQTALDRHPVRIRCTTPPISSVNVSVIIALVLSTRLGVWLGPIRRLRSSSPSSSRCRVSGVGKDSLDMLMGPREWRQAGRSRIKEIVRAHPEVLNLHDLRTLRAAGPRQVHPVPSGAGRRAQPLGRASHFRRGRGRRARGLSPARRSSSTKIRRAWSSSAPPSDIIEEALR